MEISFVISALRRYWWVLVGLVALCGLGAAGLGSTGSAAYESRAQLLVTQPINSGGSSIDADRYIGSEVQRLKSAATAQQVANDLGGGVNPATIAASVTFEQAIASNVVTVTSTATTAERAQQIANSYLTVYLNDAQDRLDAAGKPALDALTTQETDLKNQLADVDAQITQVMQRYLNAQSVPSIEVVNPSLASQRETLIADYSAIRAEIRTTESSGARLTSEIVQPATLPTEPLPTSQPKYLAAGLVAGLLIGLATAIVLGRLSSRVLDDRQVEEIIGSPIAASMPAEVKFTTDRDNMLKESPRSVWSFANTMCVRAEAQRQVGESLTVLVTSPCRGGGATTISSMMANRFAAAGLDVLLFDADLITTELSHVYHLKDNDMDSLSAFMTNHQQGEQATIHTAAGRRRRPGLSVVGLTGQADVTLLRRSDPRDLIARASRLADVVVFDGGSLLESAPTVQLMQLVDAVVVGVPIKWQDTKELTTASHELRSRENGVLPVLSPISRRDAKRAWARSAEFQTGEPPSAPRGGSRERQAGGPRRGDAVGQQHEGRAARARAKKGPRPKRTQPSEPKSARLAQSSDG